LGPTPKSGQKCQPYKVWGALPSAGACATRRTSTISTAPASKGAPFKNANASFGYGVLDFLEIAIDGYFAYERFSLSGWAPFSSFTYGGFLGARLTKMDFPFRNFVPYVQVMSGATLSIVSSPDVPGTEKLQPGFAAGAGFTYRILERFGVSFDFKWLMARHFIADLAGMNVGGLWFTVGLTLFFPSEAKREPDLPRF
jgi:hypothetical protein